MELTEWLGVQVLEKLMETGKFNRLQALDISYTQALSENAIYQFLQLHGFNLKGLMLVGKSKLTENFWLNVIPFLKNIRSVDCLVVSLPPPPPQPSTPPPPHPALLLVYFGYNSSKVRDLLDQCHPLPQEHQVGGPFGCVPPSSYHPTTLRFLYALATTHRKSELIEDFRLTVIPFLKNIRSVDRLVVPPYRPPPPSPTAPKPTPLLQPTPLLVYCEFRSLYILVRTHRESELIDNFRLSVSAFLKNIRSVGCLVVSPTLQSTLLLVYFGYNSS